jgi:hypothetical protein
MQHMEAEGRFRLKMRKQSQGTYALRIVERSPTPPPGSRASRPLFDGGTDDLLLQEKAGEKPCSRGGVRTGGTFRRCARA